jgi:hypothetical protein
MTFLQWQEKIMNTMPPEDVDIAKLASMVTTQKYLPELKRYFNNCPHRYVELLAAKVK